MVGSGLGQSAGGAEEGLLSLCSRLSGDWEPDRPKHQIRTLSSDIPSPCQSLSLLFPLLPTKDRWGWSSRPHPRPSVSPELPGWW